MSNPIEVPRFFSRLMLILILLLASLRFVVSLLFPV